MKANAWNGDFYKMSIISFNGLPKSTKEMSLAMAASIKNSKRNY